MTGLHLKPLRIQTAKPSTLNMEHLEHGRFFHKGAPFRFLSGRTRHTRTLDTLSRWFPSSQKKSTNPAEVHSSMR